MPTTPTTAARLDPEVLHPLDRLRGTIRRYVVIEGLLSAAIFVAVWFVAAMVIDFGAFKLFTWDWALDAPSWLRAVALAGGLIGLAVIVATRIARRLTTEFTYPALALVLERRFPRVLGGRLITAVELADVEAQEKYGYSKDLIRETIREARERVGTVPAADVFDWGRLRRLAAWAVGLVLGVVLVGYVSFAVSAKTLNPYRYGWKLAHVTGVLAERDLFLMNTAWPRRAHLELVGFPGDELRIGKDAAEPTVRTKAYRWVVADRAAPMGWRPMLWADVTPALAGGAVPTLPDAAFRAAADGSLSGDPAEWPVDQVMVVGMEDAASRAKLSVALGEAYLPLQAELERVSLALEEEAGKPSMGRTLRKLDLPGRVTLAYAGQQKTGDVTLAPLPNQEYAAPVPDLKESVRFVIRAEDFRTSPRDITLVPPPVFTKLVRTEYQPAYLLHAPPAGEGYSALAGLRQPMPERALSLTGDRTLFPVPAGTEMVLTATTDTDLTAAYLAPKVGVLPGAVPGSAAPVPLDIADDKRTVKVEFRGHYRFGAGRSFPHHYLDADGWVRVEPVSSTATVEFDLVVEQADGVRAKRPVMVQVVEDAPPVVEVAPDVIRKVGTNYLVTPRAKIPFNPESFVKDDHGLSKVTFDLNYWAEDSDIGRAMRVQLALRPLLYMPAPTTTLPAVTAPVFHAVKFKDLDKGDNRKTASFGVRQFFDVAGDLRRDTRGEFLRRLGAPYEDTGVPFAVKRVELKSPSRDFFDVDTLKLGVSTSEVQTRYRIDLAVTATDTNFDGGPKTGTGQEPIRLLVVSERELLAEINKEEEVFGNRLDDALAKLKAARGKWEFVRAETTAKGFGMDTVRVRAQDAAQDVAKAKDVVGSIVREYRRIHQECRVNDVTPVTRDQFGTFANRIDRVMGENPPGVTEEERRQIAAGQLAPKMTFPAAEKKLDPVLADYGKEKWADAAQVSDAELALATLEAEVRSIRQALGENETRERLRAMLISVIDQRKRLKEEMREWRERVERDLTKKEPELLPLGPLFLTKGETKRVRQGLNWRLFDKDDLTVRVTVNDAEGVTAPAMIRLNFEDVSLTNAFEYELRAGTKVGDFVVTLTPEVGDPVQVRVQVK